MMKIGIIGAGNLATHLSVALQHSGSIIVGVYSRTKVSADLLAHKLNVESFTELDKMPKADIFIFSVADAALENLSSRLCLLHPHAVFLHTAGSIPLSIFEGKTEKYGVLYPMQTFSKARAVNFKEIPCFVEGCNDECTALVSDLAKTISNSVTILDSEQRKKLHLAAVFVCNFANHCYTLGAELAEQAGIDFKVLLPLIDETAAKVHSLSPQEAQTGPAVRFDRNILEKQENELQKDETKELYRLMSKSIHLHSI